MSEKTKKERGFILVFTLVIIVLVVLSLSALFFIAYNDLTMTTASSRGMRAYYIAEAGLARKFMDLKNGNTGNLSNVSFTLIGSDSGTFSVTVTLVAGGALPTYRLDSTGTYKNVSRQVSISVKQVSFSKFAYFSNYESELFWFWRIPIWFVTGDQLSGPFHTNERINIYGDPVFEGPVSSVSSSINYYHQHTTAPYEDNPEFRDSLTLGATGLQMPTTANTLTSIQTAAAAGGRTLTRASGSGLHTSSVQFLSNGTLNFDNGRDVTNYPMPANGAIYYSSTSNLNVSGIVSGTMTLGAPGDIYITDNILYNSDPRTDPASNDMLGLVAQNNVYVHPSAPSNLEIDAYIVAISNSFEVYDYAGAIKGDLSLYGGVTQANRGTVGTFNPVTGQKASGYTKDYEYDTRLENVAPAYFPVARDANGRLVYRKVSWSES